MIERITPPGVAALLYSAWIRPRLVFLMNGRSAGMPVYSDAIQVTNLPHTASATLFHQRQQPAVLRC
jgi:hypothetical protein